MSSDKSFLHNTPAPCGCTKPARSTSLVRWTTAGGILAALGVCAACCLLPVAMLSVGVASAWAGAMDSLAPYKWIFIGLAVALLGYGFYATCFKSRPGCTAGKTCSACGPGRVTRASLWIAALLVIGGIVFEQIVPLL